jgi:hypothetical protein
MVKSRSVYMPYERERTMSEVLQGAFVNLRPICGELLLRGDNSVLQELEDVLARNADVRLLALSVGTMDGALMRGAVRSSLNPLKTAAL